MQALQKALIAVLPFLYYLLTLYLRIFTGHWQVYRISRLMGTPSKISTTRDCQLISFLTLLAQFKCAETGLWQSIPSKTSCYETSHDNWLSYQWGSFSEKNSNGTYINYLLLNVVQNGQFLVLLEENYFLIWFFISTIVKLDEKWRIAVTFCTLTSHSCADQLRLFGRVDVELFPPPSKPLFSSQMFEGTYSSNPPVKIFTVKELIPFKHLCHQNSCNIDPRLERIPPLLLQS